MNNDFDKKITVSGEDYLEASLRLLQNGQRIRVSALANELNVSKPAVTKALNELKERGYINKETYGEITLTDKGYKVAERVYKRHEFLYNFLIKIGVSPTTAEEDCCKIEHILSDETLLRIKNLNDKL